MLIIEKFLSLVSPSLPRWLGISTILGLAAATAWGYVGGLKKDALIASQEAKYASLHESTVAIINNAKEAADKQELETIIKESEGKENAHKIKQEYYSTLNSFIAAIRVQPVLPEAGSGDSDGSSPSGQTSADTPRGDHTIGKLHLVCREEACEVSRDVIKNCAKDLAAVLACKKYTADNDIPVLD